MSNGLKYIKNSYNKAFENPVGEIKIRGILVYVKDPLPSNINTRSSLNFILSKMPSAVLQGIDRIMIGDFPFLNKRQVEAVYDGGIIYITNNHENEIDFLTDIVHEIGHSFEESHKDFLYGDDSIRQEFISKRIKLFQLLQANNLKGDTLVMDDFENVHYDNKFDEFLYKKLGYPRLNAIAGDLFISPYAATSIREYFGNAFENFFINDVFLVKKKCPSVYDKLIEFLEF